MEHSYFSYVPTYLPSSRPKRGKEIAHFLALSMQLELLSQLTECWAQYGQELRKQAREATSHHHFVELYQPKPRVIEHQAEWRSHQGIHRPFVGPI